MRVLVVFVVGMFVTAIAAVLLALLFSFPLMWE